MFSCAGLRPSVVTFSLATLHVMVLPGGRTNMQKARVLVVDDFQQWREFVCTALQEVVNVEVVGIASDGAEAIDKSAALHPDVVVLDIALPTMNGIEVARRIRRVSPESAIVFLTENS